MASAFLSGMGKTSDHPVKWSVIVSICWFPNADMLRSETRSMAILSKVLSGMSVIWRGYTRVFAFSSYTVHNCWCICRCPCSCPSRIIDVWKEDRFLFLYNRINFFEGTQAFANPTDLASSGVWENVMPCKTPTFHGVCGIIFFIISLAHLLAIIVPTCWHIYQCVSMMAISTWPTFSLLVVTYVIVTVVGNH